MSEGNFDALLSSVLGNEELMGKISSIMSSHNGNQDESLPEVINAVSSTLGIKSDDMTKKQDEAIPISNVKGIPDFQETHGFYPPCAHILAKNARRWLTVY